MASACLPAASFPTRRSSDLRGSRPLPLVLLHGWPSTFAELLDVVSPLSDQDRKSTRLNSSHTVISYAVSCLKKKNEVSPVSVALIHEGLKEPDKAFQCLQRA